MNEQPKISPDSAGERNQQPEFREPYLGNPIVLDKPDRDASVQRQEEVAEANQLEAAIKQGKIGGETIEQLPPLPEKIEKKAPATPKEKFYQWAGKVFGRKIVAYGLGAVTGAVGGHEVQQLSRKGTGYDPIEHQQLLKRKKPEIEVPKQAPKKELSFKSLTEDVKEWGGEKMRLAKEFAAAPEKFIKDSETYKEILTKYYDLAKVIDDASFILPALLLLVGIGRYTDRKLARGQEKKEEKEEKENIEARFDRIEATANALIDRLEALAQEGKTPSPEDVREAQDLVRHGADTLRSATKNI